MSAGQDFARLRAPLALLALVLAGAVGGFWQLDRLRDQARAELERAQRDYRAARAAYIGAQRDDARLREATERFAALEARGLIGPEARLEWVERLSAARAAAGIERLEYELRPRRLLSPAAEPPEVALSASAMSVRSRLPHEGRLITFVDALAGEPSAWLRTRRCALQRPDAAAQAPAGLEMHCEFEWITVARRAG